ERQARSSSARGRAASSWRSSPSASPRSGSSRPRAGAASSSGRRTRSSPCPSPSHRSSAWVAAPELARVDGPVVASRPFAMVAAFAGLVWFPAVGYFVAFHGDWSYLYVVPWQHVPSAVDLGLVLLASAAVV